MKLILHPYQLRLKHTFSIAHDSRDVQETLIVELAHEGISGFGEATVSRYYHNGLKKMTAILELNKALIENYQFEPPAVFWTKMAVNLSDNWFALAALDEAIHDLYAKSKGIKVSDLWSLPRKPTIPLSNYTIGIDSVEKMIFKLKEFPWPLYKIKLGTKDDLQIIRELRSVTDARFRVDANCGWTVTETLRNAEELKKLGVEFIEQPLKADDWEGMSHLYQKCALPLIADESCITEGDVEKCAGHFHGINIKLMKCGGFTPALRMISRANQYGLQTMVGCMTESSVGIAAVAQLRPFIDYIDMDGFLLIEDDVAEGPFVKNLDIHMPDRAGIGVQHLTR